MHSFNFRFQKVLNYKQDIEVMRKNELSKVNKILIEEEDKLSSYIEYNKKILEEKNELSKNIKIEDLRMYDNYISEINKRITTQKSIVDEAERKVEKARNGLVESAKDRRILEKLKYHDYEIYAYAQKKEEEKLVDQIVTYKNAR